MTADAGPETHRQAKTQIVIIGAGYGGLAAYLTLRQRLDWKHRSLSVVNKHSYHYFTTELHTLVSGEEDEESVSVDLSQVVRRPARLLLAEVDRIVPEESRIVLKPAPSSLRVTPRSHRRRGMNRAAAAGVDGAAAGAGTADGADASLEIASPLQPYFSLRYDFLVVALGSEPEYFNLPGVRENSMVIRSLRSAERLRARLRSLASLGGDGGRYPEVVIAGGGLTGVELAGEVADAYGSHLRLTLVEAAPNIMPGLDPHLARVSRRVLQEKGVTLMTGVPIASAEPGRLYLKDGAVLPYDLLVWAGGVRGPALLARSGLATTPRGRGRVNARLQAEGFPNVYLVGDCAAFVDPATGREIAPSAQAAVQMGRAAAQAILARLQGRAEADYHPNIRGVFVSLGRDEGVGNMGAEHYAGLPAVVVKELIEGHHAFEAGGLLQILKRLFRRRRPAGAPSVEPQWSHDGWVERPEAPDSQMHAH
ncbi:MAG: NAD(P)/FAD-dependent oxidoreductase [Bacillota bacterium]